MEYAFVHNGVGYTPSGRLVVAEKYVASHNAECEAEDRARIAAGRPVVVYPKDGIVTLWTGLPVGAILRKSRPFRNPFGGDLVAYTWRDSMGDLWHGRGAGDGMMLRSRRAKV